ISLQTMCYYLSLLQRRNNEIEVKCFTYNPYTEQPILLLNRCDNLYLNKLAKLIKEYLRNKKANYFADLIIKSSKETDNVADSYFS
ncbi:MAG: hypothetical protein MHPSP_004553, partial [Paramarteilia canceri]